MVRHNASYFREKVDAQAAAQRNPYLPASPALARNTSPARRIAYHLHLPRDGRPTLYGYMAPGQPILDHCPPECTLPSSPGRIK